MSAEHKDFYGFCTQDPSVFSLEAAHDCSSIPDWTCALPQVTVQNGRVISLGIWDTAGAERFQSISRMYYHGSRAAIICFSPASQESFAKAKFWVS